MVRGTRRDLAACFVWKQVRLGFPYLASRPAEAQHWVVHVASSPMLHRGHVEDGRVDVMGSVKPFHPKIVVFYGLGPRGILFF
jgi:hypothetical protein